MKDKYMFLRESLDVLVAEAARDGATNPRAQLIIELLAERDQLAADAEDNERLRTLISDLKAWDVEQYINIPHDLRARMQAELTPNAQVVRREAAGEASERTEG